MRLYPSSRKYDAVIYLMNEFVPSAFKPIGNFGQQSVAAYGPQAVASRTGCLATLVFALHFYFSSGAVRA